MEAERSGAGRFRAIYVCAVASIAALALTIAPAGANAASPVLEFATPGGAFPVAFEADGGAVSARLGEFDRIVRCADSEGDGEITGPRTTLSSYVFTGCVAEEIGGGGTDLKCTSPGAAEEEIRSEEIEADLVYLNQSKHEVAMLLNPGGGLYMEFECGTNVIKASGPFLSPVDPVNKLAGSFEAALKRNGNAQIPSVYEGLNGGVQQAVPTAVVNTEEPDQSGVELKFTITPNVPLEIRSVNTAEVEAKQRQEEEAAAAKKRQEEEAAAKKRQEEEAAAKKRQEEEAAKAAAEKKHQELVAAEARLREEELQRKDEQLQRQKLRAKGLTRCREADSKRQRVRCEKRVKKKFSATRT